MFEQHLHYLRNAARLMQIGGNIPSRGLKVTQDRHAAAYAFKIIDRPWHFGRMGDGQKMQYRIGRATHRHDYGNSVLNGFAGDNVARPQLLPDGFNQHFRRTGRTLALLIVLRRHGGRVRQAHAHRLESGRHAIRCEHAPAGTCARTCMALDFEQFLFIYLVRSILADSLEGAHDR